MFLPPRSDQIRALVDCDSFFASCEVARRPSWRGKPVCAYRSDIVLAATYQAKAYGVSTAMPVRQAKKLLQGTGAVFVLTDMAYYEEVSRKIFSLLGDHSTRWEQYSIDEAFFERTGLCDKQSAHAYAHRLQQIVLATTQVPISIGVGPTRIVAKIFSTVDKPKGIVAGFHQQEILQRLGHLPVSQVPFIGPQRLKKFPTHTTIGQFINYPGETVRDRLGRDGLKLRLELKGYEAVSITRKGNPSSLGRARSFHPHFTTHKHLLRKHLIGNFEKVYVDLTTQGLMTQCIHVSLKTKAFKQHTFSHTFKSPTIERTILLGAIKTCFDACYQPGIFYRQTVIVTRKLIYQQDYYAQASLRELEHISSSSLQQKTQSIVNALNTKYGHRLITTATTKHCKTNKRGFFSHEKIQDIMAV